MDLPLVSAIVPVYNGEFYLSKAVASILAQTYRPLEIIVVDDGSVDNTTAIVKSYKNVRYIYQQNQGQAKAKNTGIKASQGEFLAFLDADDLWAPEKLSLQVDYLVQHPHLDFVIARMKNFLEPGTKRPVWLKKELLLNDFLGYSPGTLLARREVFKKIGYFDSNYNHADDCDWFFRARDANLRLAALPHTLLFRRIHNANRSYARQLTGASEILRVVKSSIDRKRHQKPSNANKIPTDHR